MKVALVPYPRTWLIEGGHRVQQAQTAAALGRLGVSAEVVEVEDVGRQAWDLVHFFGDPRPLLAVRPPATPLVVSPVFFPRWFYMGPHYLRGGALSMLYRRVRMGISNLRHRRAVRHREKDFQAQLEAMSMADMVIVNSHAEAALLRADTDVTPPVRVAYSGAGEAFFSGDGAAGRALLGLEHDEDFVLCVARVEPRKNQLSLAHALRGTGIHLVLVGQVLAGNEGYLAACQRALPSLHHVEHLGNDLLPHVYSAARLHVLVSWFETTGLSTVEALAAGVPVVVGAGSCVEEYFGSCAIVVDPGDLRGIRSAVQRGLARGPQGCERDLAARYNWNATAEQLLAAYTEVLKPSSDR